MLNIINNLCTILFLTTLNQTPSPHYGKVVRHKDNCTQIGLVMNQIPSGKVQIWWQDWATYNPEQALYKNSWYHYFYDPRDLIVMNDIAGIYRQPDNAVPESMIIGQQICHHVSHCQQCATIYSYWKQHWLILEGLSLSPIREFNQHRLYGCEDHFRPDDPCFREKEISENPRRCVIRGVCKMAFEDPIPDYCRV